MGRGDRDWRGDREYFGRGRRGGRSGAPNPCYHYARGRCFRGSSCRYLHVGREGASQERGTWRRDTQLEKPNPDIAREDYSGDQQNRGSWRRDLQTDRQDDFGGTHQDYMGERPKQEFVSNSNVPQEDFSREPSFNKPVLPFSQGELWAPRSADEALDRQVMAYNKALELVGIPHVPSERVIITEEMAVRDKAQQVDEKFDCSSVARKETMPDAGVTASEVPRELTSIKFLDAGITNLEGTIGSGLVDSSHKESPTVANDRVESTRFEKDNVDGEADARPEVSEQHPSGEVLPKKQDVSNISEQLEELDKSRALESLKYSINGDMDAVKGPSSAVAEIPTDKSRASGLPEEEMRSDIGPGIRGNENSGESNAAEFSKKAITLGDAMEESIAEVLKKPEAAADAGQSEAVLISKEDLQETEAGRKMNAQSVHESEQIGDSKMSDRGEKEKVVGGEVHAAAANAANAEMPVSHGNSGSSLGSHTPQNQRHGLLGQPGSGPGILPSPSDAQQQVSTGQPISAPGLLSPLPTQGQLQPPAHQPFAQSYPSVQYPSAGGDMPHGGLYGSYRPPMNRPMTSPQTFDQAARPMAKFNSGNTGYPTAGGWGPQGFQPRAQTQEAFTLNQAHGVASYATSSRPNIGPSTSGAPFFGAPNQGHHGAPYHVDQFSQHPRAPIPGDQFSQLQRPPNAGGFGHPNPGVYGPAYSGGNGLTNSAGFGPPNPSGAFLQHHVSSNTGAPFSHQQATPSPAGPFPQYPATQSQGPVFPSQPLSQNYGQSNQPSYGSTFPAQPGNPLFSQPQLMMAQQGQQGFSSNAAFLPEQSQPMQPLGGATANQVMQPSVANVGLSSNAALPSSLPGQMTAPWNLQALQRSGMLPPSQPPPYSYPLTTIPPLSGLVQAPQATNQNNQYDPLSDVTGLGGASSAVPTKPFPDGGALIDAGKTSLAAHPQNIGQDLDLGKASDTASKSETAEADTKPTNEDVGVVENVSPENWSPGPPADDAETGKDPALSKKSSRGLKMLRAAIADHVKEVLKPTWKEGYMSKEAFKTIAKKAVEKVVGNLPSHHIPKSQEKVDQYMKTSRPKISKLVQGYVDKYLKL